MKGINIFDTVTFISKYEDNLERPTKWTIGPVDQMTMTIINDRTTEFEVSNKSKGGATTKSSIQMGRKKLDLIRVGLKGFESFEHPQTGKDIAFETIATLAFGKSRNVATDDIIRLIPIIDELVEEIEKISKMSEEEEKN